jgi:hypothetical protein
MRILELEEPTVCVFTALKSYTRLFFPLCRSNITYVLPKSNSYCHFVAHVIFNIAVNNSVFVAFKVRAFSK